MRMAAAPPSSGEATWISRRWRWGSHHCPSTSALSSSKNTPVSVTTNRPPRSTNPKRARATAARSKSTQKVPATSRWGPDASSAPGRGRTVTGTSVVTPELVVTRTGVSDA